MEGEDTMRARQSQDWIKTVLPLFHWKVSRTFYRQRKFESARSLLPLDP
jgi:hypothetical protein